MGSLLIGIFCESINRKAFFSRAVFLRDLSFGGVEVEVDAVAVLLVFTVSTIVDASDVIIFFSACRALRSRLNFVGDLSLTDEENFASGDDFPGGSLLNSSISSFRKSFLFILLAMSNRLK